MIDPNTTTYSAVGLRAKSRPNAGIVTMAQVPLDMNSEDYRKQEEHKLDLLLDRGMELKEALDTLYHHDLSAAGTGKPRYTFRCSDQCGRWMLTTESWMTAGALREAKPDCPFCGAESHHDQEA